MAKRGALGISTNALVTMIITVVILGLLVVLVINLMPDGSAITGPDPKPPPTSASNPITISHTTMTRDRGDQVRFAVGVRNGPDQQAVIPQISCTPFSTVQINEQNLGPNEVGEFTILTTIADNVASGATLCQATVAGIGRVEFTVTVN